MIDPSTRFGQSVQHLPRRQQEVAFYHTFAKRNPYEGEDTYHDINMSLRYENCKVGLAPCVVCSSSLFSRRWVKHLTGSESMVLMGFPWEVLNMIALDHGWLSHKRMMELAGNAFNGYMMTAIISAILVSCGWPLHARPQWAPPDASTSTSSSSSSTSTYNSTSSVAREVASVPAVVASSESETESESEGPVK